MGNHPSPASIGSLEKVLQGDDDPRLRALAARALGGSSDPRARLILTEAVELGVNEEIRSQILAALAQRMDSNNQR